MSTTDAAVDQLRAELTAILHLVEDNHYASAFQSLGQYRTALFEFIQHRLETVAAAQSADAGPGGCK